jgi:MobA/MobL family
MFLQGHSRIVAIFYYRARVISRSAGQSACACAAYAAATQIECQRTGATYDYTERTGVNYSEIITPTISGRSINISRSQLWNLVETVEVRPDSQLARSIILALPTEIDDYAKIQLVREFIRENFTEIGMIADFSIHQIYSENPYAYILLTMRVLILIPTGGVQFGKKNRTWNNRALIKQQNQNWATVANKYLAIVGDERINHRSPEEIEVFNLYPIIET